MDQTTATGSSSDSATVPVSHRVVQAVARATDTDAVDLDPLYHHVDPEALDALFDDRPSGLATTVRRVTFRMAGCPVVVRGDGAIEVDADAAESDRTPAPGEGDAGSCTPSQSPD